MPVELLVHLAKDDNGRPLHYYAFATDLSGWKETEERIRHHNAVVEGINRILSEAIIESSEKAAALTRQLLAYAGKGQTRIPTSTCRAWFARRPTCCA